MSSSEEEVEIEQLPSHRVRFTDMPWAHVDKAIRRKLVILNRLHDNCIDLSMYFLHYSLLYIVCNKATMKCKLDKELATEIQTQIKADPELQDETAGWHVVTGKSFASAITYKTTCVLFFDLLDGHHKSFLMFKTQ